MNYSRINEHLQIHEADRISCIKNPPTANLMGGVWERHTTARSILNVLVKTHGRKSLNDESFHTLLVPFFVSQIYLLSVTIYKGNSFRRRLI